MMTVGVMVTQSDLKTLVTDKKQLMFSFSSLLVIPALSIPLLHLLPNQSGILRNFYSSDCHTYGQCGYDGGKRIRNHRRADISGSIALTYIISVVTIPIAIMLV